MLKKLSLISTLVFTLSLFTSCAVQSGVSIKSKFNDTSNSITGTYESFNGKYYKKIKLKKSDKLECSTKNNTKSGDIKLLLLDDDDNVIANLQKITTIEIPKDGYYYFTALAENHSGSFEINWSNENS